MHPTAALHALHRNVTVEAAAPAPLLPKAIVGAGKLEIRVQEAPKSPLIPARYKWVWAVFEVYCEGAHIVQEVLRRQGRKDTDVEAFQEARLVLEALKTERGV